MKVYIVLIIQYKLNSNGPHSYQMAAIKDNIYKVAQWSLEDHETDGAFKKSWQC